MSLRRNLIILAVITSLLILLVLSILQIHWANTLVIEQAVNRVKQNINVAWQVLNDHQDNVATIAII